MSIINPKPLTQPSPQSGSARRGNNRGGNKIDNLINKYITGGSSIANTIAPDVFKPDFLGRLDPDQYTAYLQDSMGGIQGTLDTFNSGNADVMARRKNALEGLNSSENTALRERASLGLDRGAMAQFDALARAQSGGGMGAGTAFAQRRAIERDALTAKGQMEQDLLLKNVDIKNQALNQYDQGVQNTFNTQFGAQSALDALRARGADTGLKIDQYNLDQKAKELAATTAATTAGIGLFQDARDDIKQQQTQNKLLEFLDMLDQRKYDSLMGIL